MRVVFTTITRMAKGIFYSKCVCVRYWGKKRKIVLDCWRHVPTSPCGCLVVQGILMHSGVFIGSCDVIGMEFPKGK